MEERRENPVFGRKVFFLNPSFAVQKIIIGKLKEEEYEVHVLEDYHYAKNILRRFPDSICFINTDVQLTPVEWINFMNSFQLDNTLKTIYLGVLSERMRKADSDQFIIKTSLPAGIISMTDGIENTYETIKGILEINGAKGRRQYIRAQCSKDNNAYLYWTYNGKMVQLKMLDISSVGTATILPQTFYSIVKPNDVIRDIIIILGSKSVQVNAVVFAIKDNTQTKTLVLLFTKGMSHNSKNIVREYVFRTLDGEVLSVAAGKGIDNTDYKKTVELPGKKNEAFLMNVSQSELAEQSSAEQHTSFSNTTFAKTELF